MPARYEKGFGRVGFCLSRQDSTCPLTTLVDTYSTDTSHSDAHLVVWELMKLLWVVEHLRELSVLRAVPPQSPFCQCGEGILPTEPSPSSAAAVFFGAWRAVEVSLPAHVSLTSNQDALMVRSLMPDPGKDATMVEGFLKDAFLYSGRPNHFEPSCPVARLELRFFEYFLRRHLNVCFHTATFQDGRIDLLDYGLVLFLECGTIFSHDDVQNRCQQ